MSPIKWQPISIGNFIIWNLAVFIWNLEFFDLEFGCLCLEFGICLIGIYLNNQFFINFSPIGVSTLSG